MADLADETPCNRLLELLHVPPRPDPNFGLPHY